MSEKHAGGRTTQTPSPRAENMLEIGLSEVTGAVSALLADARVIDPAQDEFGHARSRAYDDAVNLLKVSAKLGQTIARLRGSTFEHTINVRREQVQSPSFVTRDDDEVIWEPEEELRQYQGCDYNRRLKISDGRHFVRGKGWIHVPEGWDEKRWRAGLPQRAGEMAAVSDSESWDASPGEGDPPPNSGGSNGNFEAAVPRIRSL